MKHIIYMIIGFIFGLSVSAWLQKLKTKNQKETPEHQHKYIKLHIDN